MKQQYIKKCRIVPKKTKEADIDLTIFRRHRLWGKRTIPDVHFISLYLVPPRYKPWLQADSIKTNKIILHRSLRYPGMTNYNFLADFDVTLLGLHEEIEAWKKVMGGKLPVKWVWKQAKDLSELASYINGADVFVGNQSSPLAVAAGLGKKRLVEVSSKVIDCCFGNELILTPDSGVNRNLLEILTKD